MWSLQPHMYVVCVCAHAHAWCGVLGVTRWCCCDAPATTNYIPTPRASCLSCPTIFTRTFNPTTLGATPTTSHAAHCLHWTSSCTCAWRASCTLQFTRTYHSSTNRHVNSRHIWSHTAQECLVHTLLSAPAMTELAVEVSGSYTCTRNHWSPYLCRGRRAATVCDERLRAHSQRARGAGTCRRNCAWTGGGDVPPDGVWYVVVATNHSHCVLLMLCHVPRVSHAS